jgi:eukaryotic-like serine/threonine-protein kinase
MSSRGTELSAARVGTWLRDKYRLDRILGEGGMAVVYAATHRNKKRFAVKVLHRGYSSSSEVHGRFLREGYVANTVDHPGAVAVIDDDVAEDGSAFLVMELLEGATVESLRVERGGKLELPVVLAVAYQLLDVLAAAHERGVVHRDIKPENVFVTRAGLVKVLDFGIARLREENVSSSATKTGMHLGTPAFMSPEQASGRTSQVEARSDLWSVGATLFHLLTGRDVHIGETPQHMVMLAATTPAPSLASVMPGVPSSVAEIVDRALALDKNLRWAKAAAMREAVRIAYEELTGEAVSPRLLAQVALERAGAAGELAEPLNVTGPTLSSTTLPSALDDEVLPAKAATAHPPIASASRTMDPVSSSPARAHRVRRWVVAGLLVGASMVAVAALLLASLRSRSAPTSTAGQASAPSAPVPPSTGTAEPASAASSAATSPMPPATTPVAEADASPDPSVAKASSIPRPSPPPRAAPAAVPAHSGRTKASTKNDFDRQ